MTGVCDLSTFDAAARAGYGGAVAIGFAGRTTP